MTMSYNPLPSGMGSVNMTAVGTNSAGGFLCPEFSLN